MRVFSSIINQTFNFYKQQRELLNIALEQFITRNEQRRQEVRVRQKFCKKHPELRRSVAESQALMRVHKTLYSGVKQELGSDRIFYAKGGYSVYVDEENTLDEEIFPYSSR